MPARILRFLAQTAETGGDHQGTLRLDQPIRELFDERRVWMGRRGDGARLGAGVGRGGRRQRLARQRQIHGTARLGHGRLDSARDHQTGLGGIAQLVVPLDELAHHARPDRTSPAPSGSAGCAPRMRQPP